MQCRVCGNTEGNGSYEVKEMMFGLREKFAYFQCFRCGCLQITDIPANMSKYYPNAYYSFTTQIENNLSKKENLIKRILKKWRDEYAIFNRGFLSKALYLKFPNDSLRDTMRYHFPITYSIVSFKKKSKILDVGCGNGRYLYQLRECGFKHLLGIDPYVIEGISYKNGLKIDKKTIFQVEGEFDFIIFNHSFEHMAEPLETLKAVSRLLSKKGICIIRIPTVSSYSWEHYRENWVQLDAPRHFFLHSISSMSVLSKKANLNVNRIIYDSNEFQFVGSELYLKDIPLNTYYESNPIFSKEDMDHFKEKANELNEANKGDQVAFYLERN